MSVSAGFSYDGERFEKHFADFHQKYGITDMYSGGFYPYHSLEEYWAWWSRHIWINRYDVSVGKPYTALLQLMKGKVPKCPICGAPMTMNLRCDNSFVQDKGWYEAASRYEEFIRQHKGKRILFLELGVGVERVISEIGT